MSEFNPKFELEGIVRKVNPRQALKKTTGDKKLIIIDENTGKITKKTRPFKKYRKYLIYSDVLLKDELKSIEIEDFESLDSIQLNIAYKVQCPYENAEKLIEKLFYGSGEYPQRKLNALIERIIEDYVDKFDSPADFFRNFFKYRQNLIKELKKRILQEVGLRFEGHVAIAHENELQPVQIETDYFEVFVNNYDGGLKVKIKALLDVHPEQEYKICAILQFDKQEGLGEIAKATIKKTLLQEVSLDDFTTNFERVKEVITKELGTRLRTEGRMLSHLSIKSETVVKDEEREFILDEYIVGCKLKDSQIDVTHNLILTIDNLGKFKNAGISDLNGWAKKNLDSITKHVLFDKTYLDLILSYEKKDGEIEVAEKNPPEEIKKQMGKAAAKIGFKVKQLVTVPNVKPLELINGFNFEVGDMEEFSTLNTRIKVKLMVSVSGRISDLKKIEKHINPQVDIISKMKNKVKEGVKQVIDTIEPERYYIRFKHIDPELGDKQSVEKELIDVISRKLKKEFHASELTITPKQLDTDITIRFAQLMSKLYDFQFETFPFREGGSGEKVEFFVQYQIDNVHPKGWHRFQSKKFGSIEDEVNQINALLQNHLKDTLSTVHSEEIMYRDLSDSEKLRKIANLKLAPIVAQAFGLQINILLVSRSATRLENKYHDRRQKVIDIHEEKIEIEKKTSIALANLKKTELDSLIDKYRQLQGIPEFADEAEEVKRKIEEFPSQFDEMDIGDGFGEVEENDGTGLDQLLSFLSVGNQPKQISSAVQTEDELQAQNQEEVVDIDLED